MGVVKGVVHVVVIPQKMVAAVVEMVEVAVLVVWQPVTATKQSNKTEVVVHQEDGSPVIVVAIVVIRPFEASNKYETS